MSPPGWAWLLEKGGMYSSFSSWCCPFLVPLRISATSCLELLVLAAKSCVSSPRRHHIYVSRFRAPPPPPTSLTPAARALPSGLIARPSQASKANLGMVQLPQPQPSTSNTSPSLCNHHTSSSAPQKLGYLTVKIMECCHFPLNASIGAVEPHTEPLLFLYSPDREAHRIRPLTPTPHGRSGTSTAQIFRVAKGGAASRGIFPAASLTGVPNSRLAIRGILRLHCALRSISCSRPTLHRLTP